ncbi:amino acid transporter-like protein, partial [Euroglyphus maynei]
MDSNMIIESTTNSIDSKHRDGFSVITATFFIVGELAGGGLLTLSHAVSLASWFGIPIIIFASLCAGIAGYYLAKSWMILEDHYPQYRNSLTRKPFATIGSYAYGRYMGAFVSIMMNVTNTCATTVFILFTSDLLSQLTKSFIGYNICQWIPITSLAFLIPILFGSPIDFWPIAYLATLSTTFGSILLIISLGIQVKRHGFSNEFRIKNFENFSSCFGIAFYAFGGAGAFPNFQNDMRDKNQFSRAVIFGFIGLLMLYIPVASFGYAAFGMDASANILNNFESDKLLDTFIVIVRCCFLVHFCTVIPITINPVFLDLEELLRIPK